MYIAHWNGDLFAKVMKIYDVDDKDVKASYICGEIILGV